MPKAQIRHNTLKDGRVRWFPVIDLGIDPETGKRLTDTWPGGPWDTEREAIEMGTRLEAKYSTDATKQAELEGKKLFRDIVEVWFSEEVVNKDEKTQDEYRKRMKNWILPNLGTHHMGKELPKTKAVCLGKMQMKSVTTADIEAWAIKLKPLSLSYRGSLLNTLNVFLNYAVRKKIILVNPTQGAKVDHRTGPQKKAAKVDLEMSRKEEIWDQETLPRLIEASIGDGAEALVILGGLAGFRPGEVEGCQDDDIDYVRGRVLVQAANRASRLKAGKYTKGGGIRWVPVNAETLQLLAAMKERKHEEARAKGQTPSPWVMPIALRTAATNLTKLTLKAGVKTLHPHCLRHSYASILLSERVPITTVAELLGHANSGITERYYAHAIIRDINEAPLVIGRAINLRGVVDRALDLHSEDGQRSGNDGQRLNQPPAA